MISTSPTKSSGNRCGHDPRNPRLSPPEPVKVGPGAPPRILSLAVERARKWFFNPQKCPLFKSKTGRNLRSERREAIQVVLEYLLSRLDLATLCIGSPTLNVGFVDLDMGAIVAGTGLSQRRCERAIASLKAAGFMEVKQPRHRNEEGKYYGLRAIRVLTRRLFEWLGLGPMLERERARASKTLKERVAKFGLSLSDAVRRPFRKMFKPILKDRPRTPMEVTLAWIQDRPKKKPMPSSVFPSTGALGKGFPGELRLCFVNWLHPFQPPFVFNPENGRSTRLW